MKKVLIPAFFMLLCSTIWAQSKDFYKNSIDIAGGLAFAPVRIHEHEGVTTLGKGAEGSLRYTRYFDEHRGAFIQFELAGTSLNKESYYAKLGELDLNQYSYNAFKTLSTCPGVSHDGVFLGGTYRLDLGRCSIRPYVGIGYAEAYLHVNRYYRTDKDGTREAVIVAPSKNENSYSIMRLVLAGKCGLQVKYTIGRYFNIGADLNLTAFAARNRYTVKVYKTEKREPNIVGELLTLGMAEDYSRTEVLSTTYSKRLIPPSAALKFNLGWDF